MRYTIEAAKVDGGSHCTGFAHVSDALGAAQLVAFALGGHDAACAVAAWKKEMRRRNARPVRLTFEPGSKAWSVTLRVHNG